MLALALWLRLLVAVALFATIATLGIAFLVGLVRGRPPEPAEPEDVAELDVFFVCTECGTEFQVTRLGEAQIPRHCGEPMSVERRPQARR